MNLTRSTSKESIISAVSKVGDWEIGDRCQIEKRIGSIVYIGPTNFAPGEWIGLVLDKPLGKNDGSVDGQRYFTCAPNHGLFCKASKLERIQSSVSEIIPENPYTKEFGFDVGDRVVVSGGKIGTIRYLGNTDFQDGIWAGIELDQPVGKNDGSVQGKRYFTCQPFHGLFAAASKITRVPNQSPAKIKIRHTKTSALRQRSGSHESLASIGASSIASSRISKFSFAPQRNIQRPIVLSSARGLDELVTTLQDSLKEKEKHLEQMIKERDLERNEMARLSNHCEEVEAKLALFEGQMTGSTHSAILEDKLINLKSRNATVEAENQDLMLEVKEKTEKIDELTFLLEEKEIMCAEISEKLAEVNKTDVEKKSKVVVLENTLKELEIHCRGLEEQIEDLMTDRETLYSKLQETESELNRLEELRRIDGQNRENYEKTAKISVDQEKYIAELENRFSLMETSKKSVEKENNDLVEKLKSSEQQLRNLTEKLNDMVESRKIHEELIKDREEQLDQHRMKAEEWKDNISRLEAEIIEATHQADQLAQSKAGVDDELKIALSRVLELETMINRSDENRRSLEDLRASQESQIKIFKQQITELEGELTSLREKNSKTESQLQILKDKMEISNSNLIESNEKFENLNALVDQLKMENQKQLDQLSLQDDNLKSLNESYEKMKLTNNELEENIIRLQKALDMQQILKDKSDAELQAALARIQELETMIRANLLQKNLIEELKNSQKSETTSYMEKIMELSNEISRLKEDNVRVLEESKLFQKDKAHLETKISEISNEKATVIAELNDMKIVNEEQNLLNEKQNKELQALAEEVAKLNECNSSAEKSIADLINGKEELNLAYNKVKDENENFINENNALKAEILQITEKAASLSSEISARALEFEILNETQTRSEQEILELNVKLEAAKNDKTDYEVKLKKAICQIDDLEIKLSGVEQQLAQMTANNEILISEVKQRDENLKILNASEEKLKQQTNSLSAELEKIKLCQAETISSIKSSDNLKLELNDSLLQLQNEKKSLLNTISQLNEDTEGFKKVIQQMNEEKKQLLTDCGEVEVLKANNAAISNDLANCLIDFENLQTKFSSVQKLYDESKTELEMLKMQFSTHNQNQSAVERQLAKLRDENNVLKEGKENVENELILLKNKVMLLEKAKVEDEIVISEAEKFNSLIYELDEEWKEKEKKYQEMIEELRIKANKTDNETIEELSVQINFLNSIIASQQSKESELKRQIDILNQIPATETLNELHSRSKTERPPRLYCDICEVFDVHDTTDCPAQQMDIIEYESHSHHNRRQQEPRPYCDICEAFLHNTADCPTKKMKSKDYTF